MYDFSIFDNFVVHPLSLTNGSHEDNGFQVRNLLFWLTFPGEPAVKLQGCKPASGYSLLHYAAECVTDPEAGLPSSRWRWKGFVDHQSLMVATLWHGCDADF